MAVQFQKIDWSILLGWITIALGLAAFWSGLILIALSIAR